MTENPEKEREKLTALKEEACTMLEMLVRRVAFFAFSTVGPTFLVMAFTAVPNWESESLRWAICSNPWKATM